MDDLNQSIGNRLCRLASEILVTEKLTDYSFEHSSICIRFTAMPITIETNGNWYSLVESCEYTVLPLKLRHSKYSSPARNLSKCILIAGEFPVSNIRHIALIICQTGRAFQCFVTRDRHSLRTVVFVLR